jgi:hypothetical protein
MFDQARALGVSGRMFARLEMPLERLMTSVGVESHSFLSIRLSQAEWSTVKIP